MTVIELRKDEYDGFRATPIDTLGRDAVMYFFPSPLSMRRDSMITPDGRQHAIRVRIPAEGTVVGVENGLMNVSGLSSPIFVAEQSDDANTLEKKFIQEGHREHRNLGKTLVGTASEHITAREGHFKGRRKLVTFPTE